MSFDIPDCIYFEGLTKNKVEARDIDFKTNFIYSVLDKEKKIICFTFQYDLIQQEIIDFLCCTKLRPWCYERYKNE